MSTPEYKNYKLDKITVYTLLTNIPLLMEYLDAEGNPNTYNSTNLLVWCVNSKMHEQMELLLNYGADPNYRSAEYLRDSPLAAAIVCDDLIAAETLMKYGAELRFIDRDHPLAHYAKMLNLEGVKLALKYGANPNDDYSYYYSKEVYPPLYHAIFTKRSKTDETVLLKIVHLLLDHGSKPDIMVHGKPIFHFFVQDPDCYPFSINTAKRLIVCFLDHGADINVKYHGKTVMEYVHEEYGNTWDQHWFIELVESYRKSKS